MYYIFHYKFVVASELCIKFLPPWHTILLGLARNLKSLQSFSITNEITQSLDVLPVVKKVVALPDNEATPTLEQDVVVINRTPIIIIL